MPENQLTIDLKEWMTDKFAAMREHVDLRLDTVIATIDRNDRDTQTALAETRASCVALEGRVNLLESDRDQFRGSWRVIAFVGAGSGALGLLASKVFDALGG